MMTDEQLRAIAERCDAATPEPWEKSNSGFTIRHDGGNVATMGAKDDTQAKVDAAFIAAARQDVPALLAEIADLRRQLAAMTIRYEAMRRSEDVATLRWGEAWADADDLRRQLAEALGELDICRLSLAASEQARIKAEEMVDVLRIRLALDKPLPPPTCGHRGMAGSVGCVLPEGHPGEHEYRRAER